MRIKVIILTVLAIVAMLMPTASALAAETQFWTGSATVTIVDPVEVYRDAGCTLLVTTGQTFPVSPNPKIGDVKTLQLWIKNTSTTTDYTITPQAVYDSTAFAITGIAPIVVNKSTVGSFTFTATALKAGAYTLTLNLSHN